jgi:hypothetical protein
MVFVEVIDIFARDDVDLCVPLTVETVKLGKLLLLQVSKTSEIFQDNVDRHSLQINGVFYEFV